jgi:hypothetical protein
MDHESYEFRPNRLVEYFITVGIGDEVVPMDSTSGLLAF